MPDIHARLTAEEKAHVTQWLQKNGKHHACPVCDHNKWAIADHLMDAPVAADQSRTIVAESYPMIALVCTHCAHARFFMALPMGVRRHAENG